ncbi:MAG: hypothetical protein OEZ14_15920, partial [Acidimicrobiia bacterium]|nr:hypothetical protein [Acidimicrobiia bacterium]
MSATLHGADLEGLDHLGEHFTRASQSIRTLTNIIGFGVMESDRFWHGPDAAGFKQQWFDSHRAAMVAAAVSLSDAAEVIGRNRDEQAVTSSVDTIGVVGTSTGGSGVATMAGLGRGPIIDFLLGDVANFWNGGADEGFPVGQLTAALIRVGRTAAFLGGGPLPTFNTGLVGRLTAAGLNRIPAMAPYGAWLGSPAATTFFKRAGVAGGLVGTGLGLYDLYQQGNPIDAFQANPAGYVADVASTAFSASTAAFFLAPSPITAGLVIGTGVVWAGAEVVENWDDITEWTSDTWNATTD